MRGTALQWAGKANDLYKNGGLVSGVARFCRGDGEMCAEELE